MQARPDGTVPQIQHGSVFLRPAEKDDVELFVRWLNDWRTGRTLGMRAPLSKGMEEKWVERLIEQQGKEGYHFVICLLADDRPLGTIGLKDLNLIDGSAGLGISVGAEGIVGGATAAMPSARCSDSASTSFGSSASGSTSTT